MRWSFSRTWHFFYSDVSHTTSGLRTGCKSRECVRCPGLGPGQEICCPTSTFHQRLRQQQLQRFPDDTTIASPCPLLTQWTNAHHEARGVWEQLCSNNIRTIPFSPFYFFLPSHSSPPPPPFFSAASWNTSKVRILVTGLATFVFVVGHK